MSENHNLQCTTMVHWLSGNKKGGDCPPFSIPAGRWLQAVVHLEFERMRGHAERGQLFFLQRDVGIEHVVGEHAAAREELAILVELFERLLERMTDLGHAR